MTEREEAERLAEMQFPYCDQNKTLANFDVDFARRNFIAGYLAGRQNCMTLVDAILRNVMKAFRQTIEEN